MNHDRFLLGAPHCPEHVDESYWQRDAERLAASGGGADFDNQEAHRTYALGMPSSLEDAVLLHRQCYDSGIACGFIHPEDDLSRLKVLYVPPWVMCKPDWTARVDAFVAAGGTLILSALTGTRDSDNHIHRSQVPGRGWQNWRGPGLRIRAAGGTGASGLFPTWPDAYVGVHRPGVVADAASAGRKYRFSLGNREYEAGHLYEKLEVQPGTEVLGQWTNRWLQGGAAVTSRNHGKGRVVYAGTYLTPELAAGLVETVCRTAGVVPLVADLPAGVEVTVRQADDRVLYFVQNTTDAVHVVGGAPVGVDLLTGQTVPGEVTLAAYGRAVIKAGAA